jgi:hypothetical protein
MNIGLTPPSLLHVYAYAAKAGSSSSSRRYRQSPAPYKDKWTAKEELTLPAVHAFKVFNDADFVDNDEAEVGTVEELRCVSPWEAGDPKQLEEDLEEDERYAFYHVRTYEFQRKAAVRHVKIERIVLD